MPTFSVLRAISFQLNLQLSTRMKIFTLQPLPVALIIAQQLVRTANDDDDGSRQTQADGPKPAIALIA